MFANNPVDINSLPNADSVHWQRLHPRTRIAALITGGLPALVLVAAGCALYWFGPAQPFIALRFADYTPVLWLLAGLLILNLVRQQIAIGYCGYALREHDVMYRNGIFFRRRAIVPINRIQHVEVRSGPIERRLGLARLKLFTAGTAFGDLAIHGLHQDTATRMRRYLLSRGDQDSPAEPSPPASDASE